MTSATTPTPSPNPPSTTSLPRAAPEDLPCAHARATRAPAPPDATASLGYVQLARDHSPDPTPSWQNSRALRPAATASQNPPPAKRESPAESDFSQRESSHFNL